MIERNENINYKKTYRADAEKKSLSKRLNIIEGQIRGINNMIENDRYCDDILTQLVAVNKAIKSLENMILERHLENCISEQIKKGNTEITEEIKNLFKKLN